MSALVTHQMEKKMEELDIPPIPEFVQMIADSGAEALRLQGVGRHVRPEEGRLHRQVEDIITVGEFYELAAGGQIIFT